MKEPSWRSYVALALCLGSVGLALVIRRLSLGSWYPVTEMVAVVWWVTGLWLGRWLHLLKRGPAAIYHGYREGRHRMPPLPKLMVQGGLFLSVLALSLLFIK